MPVSIELHLLEYKQRMLEYLDFYTLRINQHSATPSVLHPFSAPNDPAGYRDASISNDLVTEVYLEYCERTRNMESGKYL